MAGDSDKKAAKAAKKEAAAAAKAAKKEDAAAATAAAGGDAKKGGKKKKLKKKKALSADGRVAGSHWLGQPATPLTPEQEAMVEEFLAWSKEQPTVDGLAPTRFTAVKFMRGTKFRMEKAQTKWGLMSGLLQNEMAAVSDEQVHEWLRTGVVMMPVLLRDREGRSVAIITVEHLNKDLDLPWVRAKASLYLNEYMSALDERVQEVGGCGLLDLSNAPMNFDKPRQREGTQLNEAYPARFGRFIVVDPPWYFRTIFRLAKAVFPAKLMARVAVITKEELDEFIDHDELTVRLGGNLTVDVEETAENVMAFMRERAELGDIEAARKYAGAYAPYLAGAAGAPAGAGAGAEDSDDSDDDSGDDTPGDEQ